MTLLFRLVKKLVISSVLWLFDLLYHAHLLLGIGNLSCSITLILLGAQNTKQKSHFLFNLDFQKHSYDIYFT